VIAAHAGDDLPDVMFAVVDELDLAMTGADAVSPCMTALRLEAALPALVFGPPRGPARSERRQARKKIASVWWHSARKFVL